ncbi:uncharacterized protein LOC135694324 [Rhopilema esculentum]|uniref:uncharacterized protein LOC135694324 n=1 Tax=Rhopilema esculentum TaxID=499914 RepID=UPI0031D3FFEB|eukprot:gene4748-21050_t
MSSEFITKLKDTNKSFKISFRDEESESKVSRLTFSSDFTRSYEESFEDEDDILIVDIDYGEKSQGAQTVKEGCDSPESLSRSGSLSNSYSKQRPKFGLRRFKSVEEVISVSPKRRRAKQALHKTVSDYEVRYKGVRKESSSKLTYSADFTRSYEESLEDDNDLLIVDIDYSQSKALESSTEDNIFSISDNFGTLNRAQNENLRMYKSHEDIRHARFKARRGYEITFTDESSPDRKTRLSLSSDLSASGEEILAPLASADIDTSAKEAGCIADDAFENDVVDYSFATSTPQKVKPMLQDDQASNPTGYGNGNGYGNRSTKYVSNDSDWNAGQSNSQFVFNADEAHYESTSNKQSTILSLASSLKNEALLLEDSPDTVNLTNDVGENVNRDSSFDECSDNGVDINNVADFMDENAESSSQIIASVPGREIEVSEDVEASQLTRKESARFGFIDLNEIVIDDVSASDRMQEYPHLRGEDSSEDLQENNGDSGAHNMSSRAKAYLYVTLQTEEKVEEAGNLDAYVDDDKKFGEEDNNDLVDIDFETDKHGAAQLKPESHYATRSTESLAKDHVDAASNYKNAIDSDAAEDKYREEVYSVGTIDAAESEGDGEYGEDAEIDKYREEGYSVGTIDAAEIEGEKAAGEDAEIDKYREEVYSVGTIDAAEIEGEKAAGEDAEIDKYREEVYSVGTIDAAEIEGEKAAGEDSEEGSIGEADDNGDNGLVSEVCDKKEDFADDQRKGEELVISNGNMQEKANGYNQMKCEKFDDSYQKEIAGENDRSTGGVFLSEEREDEMSFVSSSKKDMSASDRKDEVQMEEIESASCNIVDEDQDVPIKEIVCKTEEEKSNRIGDQHLLDEQGFIDRNANDLISCSSKSCGKFYQITIIKEDEATTSEGLLEHGVPGKISRIRARIRRLFSRNKGTQGTGSIERSDSSGTESSENTICVFPLPVLSDDMEVLDGENSGTTDVNGLTATEKGAIYFDTAEDSNREAEYSKKDKNEAEPRDKGVYLNGDCVRAVENDVPELYEGEDMIGGDVIGLPFSLNKVYRMKSRYEGKQIRTETIRIFLQHERIVFI